MTNIEKIRQEIDTRRQHMVEELMGHEENCEYHRIKGMHDAYVDLLTFLDYSLPDENNPEPYNPVYDEDYLNEKIAKATKSWEGVDVNKMLADCRGYEEKPSEDLEEAAEKRARKIYPYEGGAKGLICENAIPIYKAGFIAGAEWQRKQDAARRK